MIKQNLHTHSIYCDGKNTLEEMTEAAIKSGFSSIGFSGHCYTPFDNSYCMSLQNTNKYCTEIDELKEKYKNKIKIYKGIEYDLYSEYDTSEFDYIIGSVHYILKDGKYIDVDLSAENVSAAIKKYFDGDEMAYVRAYFNEIIKVPDQTGCDILGHFDLVSKFCEKSPAFDTKGEEYMNCALEAVNCVSKKIKVFEVNTGAMSRGYRTLPYPSVEIIRAMKKSGMMPVVTSDCHNKEHIDYGFDVAYRLLRNAGYTTALIFDEGKFVEYPV